jgi:hypothetical protein
MASRNHLESSALSQLAARLLIEAPAGVDVPLPRAGTTLENPHVYDSVARELMQQATSGRLQVVHQDAADGLIREMVFRRR